MMEYAKVILPKVCFWESLFKKELMKCISWTSSDELFELCAWCYNNFGERHSGILDEAFAKIIDKNRSGLSAIYTDFKHYSQAKHRKALELV